MVLTALKLLKEIDKQAKNNNRIINCLLQVHIAEEDTKFGFDASEVIAIVTSDIFKNMQNIHINGLMGMATFTPITNQVKREFNHLKQVFDKVKEILPHVSILSMGMSGDYKIAIEEGSTMVRIGSSIFGDRSKY